LSSIAQFGFAWKIRLLFSFCVYLFCIGGRKNGYVMLPATENQQEKRGKSQADAEIRREHGASRAGRPMTHSSGTW